MPDLDPFDAQLDRLFQRSVPSVSADFTARLKQRLHDADPGLDEDDFDTALDAHLAAWPVEPRPDFTPRTLERLHTEERSPKILRFPVWIPLTGAAAAAAVLAWSGLALNTPAPTMPTAEAVALAAAPMPEWSSDRPLSLANRIAGGASRINLANAQALDYAEPSWDRETAAVLGLTDYIMPDQNAAPVTHLDPEAVALLAADRPW